MVDSSIVDAYFLQVYVSYAAAALVVYEYVITLPREVQRFWKRKWTGATWLFLSNRYLLIAAIIAIPYGSQSCVSRLRVSEAITVTMYLVFGLFSALRVYALWERSMLWFSVVSSLSLVPMVSNSYIYAHTSVSADAVPGVGRQCIEPISISPSVNFHLVLATRLAVIAADCLVVVLTWLKTYHNNKEALDMGIRLPICASLFRDGTIYFLAILTMNIAQILADIIPVYQNIIPHAVTLFNCTLTSILISRFLLHLRQTTQFANDTLPHTISQFTMSNFHVPTLINVAANMGDSLAYHGEYVEEDFSDDGTDLSSEISTITDICGPCDVYPHNVEVYKKYAESRPSVLVDLKSSQACNLPV